MKIDARGHTIGRWNGRLKAICAEEFERNALYGESQEEAFLVDTGPQVNTEATKAAGELRAVLGLKVSPMAERVFVVHATPGGSVYRLAREALDRRQPVLCFDHPTNRELGLRGATPAPATTRE